MIYWQKKPDMLFKKVLKRAIKSAIAEIDESLELFGSNENNTFFQDDIVKMFGGMEKLRDHVVVLHNVSSDKKTYEISDYSFLLLDIMLTNFCDVYSDMVSGECTDDYSIKHRGKMVLKLDADEFIDLYFFDTDYNLDPQVYNEMDQETKEQLGFGDGICDTPYGVINRMIPHPDELNPREIKV